MSGEEGGEEDIEGKRWDDQEYKGVVLISAILLWTVAGWGMPAEGFKGDDMAVRVIRVSYHVDSLIPTQRVSERSLNSSQPRQCPVIVTCGDGLAESKDLGAGQTVFAQ